MEAPVLRPPSATLRLGMSQVEAAARLGVSRRTLHNWQRTNYGPQPVRDGARLLYDPADVAAFAAGAVS